MVINRRILIIVLFTSLLLSSVAFGAPAEMLIVDNAGLFNDSDINSLTNSLSILSDNYNMDIVIVTTYDAEGKSSRDYSDDYFDYNGYGRGDDRSGILFLIDMDNREAYISTSGEGIRYLTDMRIERVLDSIFDSGLSQGDYYGAALGFIDMTSYYLDQGVPSDQHTVFEGEKEKNKFTPFEAVASLLASLGVGGGFYSSITSRYKVKNPPNPFSYRNNSIVNLANNSDRLIDQFVTSRIIPRTPPSGGGSGSSSGRSTVHRSSSGRSHGGGGRKF